MAHVGVAQHSSVESLTRDPYHPLESLRVYVVFRV